MAEALLSAGARSRLEKARDSIGSGLFGIFGLGMNALGLGFNAIQKWIGVRGMAYIFIMPHMVLFTIFSLLPIALNFYYSVTGGLRPLPQDRWFVGFDNYNTLLTCESIFEPNTCVADLFWRGVFNTVLYVVFEVGALLLFSVVTAIMLNRTTLARGFFRSVFFYPVLLSSVVIGLIWRWTLQREGIVNAGLEAMGLETINFLLNVDWARFWSIFVGVWANLGFYTLIVLAGLQSIPAMLYEAAKVDGATGWDQFRLITLPMLRPTMLIVAILSLIRSVQVFDHVYVLTGGGPGTSTQYIVQYIYNTGFATDARNYGLATAASILVGLVLIGATLIRLRFSRSED
jgi:alpha-1,4-digalacturonate transport system permease protein